MNLCTARGQSASPRFSEGSAQSWWRRDFQMGVEHFLRADGDSIAALPHTHAEYVFTFCLAGRMELMCGQERHALEAEEMLAHKPGQVHQSCYGAGQRACEGVSLVVSPSLIAELMKRMPIPHSPNPERDNLRGKIRDEAGAELVRRLLAELRNAPVGYEVMVDSLATQLLVHLLRDRLVPACSRAQPGLLPQLPAWEIIQAMKYMSTHGKKDFSLSELCSLCRTSPSRFIPLFRNSTRLNPRKYFDGILIQRARLLLNRGHSTTKEVAYVLGFRNPSHFCRLFRDIAGTTPTLYQLGRATLQAPAASDQFLIADEAFPVVIGAHAR